VQAHPLTTAAAQPFGAAARYWLAAGQVIFYAILEVARHA